MANLKEIAKKTLGDYRYLMVVEPYNLSTSTRETLYFSDKAYMQRTVGVNSYDYVRFEPRISSPLNIDISMFSAGKIGGRVKASGGDVRLANPDGVLDYLLNYSWDQAPVTMRLNRDSSPDDEVESDHFVYFQGVTKSIGMDEDEVTIVVVDRKDKLEEPFPPNKFTTGDAIGRPIPVLFGQVYNISPVLIDASTNTYKIHDGAITAIDTVYIDGVATGSYTADLPNGQLSFSTAPGGIVTCDARRNVTLGLYTNGPGAIIYELATTYAGFVHLTDISSINFSSATVNPYTVGGWYPSEIKVIDAVNEFLDSCGAVLTGASGLLDMEIVTFPTSDPSTLLVDPITDDEIIDIELLPSAPPPSTIVLNYKKNYRKMTENELGASPANREFMVKDSETITDSTGLSTAYPSAQELIVDTLITNSTDATTEAARLADTFYSSERRVYRIRMKTNPLYIDIGSAVLVESSRFGLQDGEPMLVLSLLEDLAVNEVVLEVAK